MTAFPFETQFIQLGPRRFRTDEVHDRLSTLVTPARLQKIISVCKARRFAPTVVLENIYDRGNQSAVLRSTEAYGFARVQIIEGGAKLKTSQRTTAGAEKWLEKTHWKSTEDCLRTLKSEGLQILVTALSDQSVPLSQVDWTRPAALLMGNEKEGASAIAQEMADQKVIIPMSGFVQSFNISVAASLCLSEMDKHCRPDLDAEQIKRLECEYFLRTLDSSEDLLGELQDRGELWGKNQ